MKPSKKLLTGTLATGLLFSATTPFNVFAEKQTVTMDEAVKILSALSSEERKALEQLEIGPGFVISPDINTKTAEQVNVIVEFNQAPAQVEVKKESMKGKKLSLSTAKEKVNASHKEFKNYVNSLKARKSGTTYDTTKLTIKQEYKTAFNGVSMTLPGIAVEELLHSGAVKRIWSDAQVQLELPSQDQLKIKPKMADSIPQIGVDKLHAENITGKGIKVGVLDTGIDYSHPDLAAAYKGYRAETGVDPKNVDPSTVKGWDFVNNDADPMETTYEEWKNTTNPEYHPSLGTAYYTSHGTHVSGTIAAGKNNPVDYAVKGVAPDVDLYAYKVLGEYGSGTTEGVLAGIDKAVSDGMDVINLSLGASINDPLYPTSVAINNAMLSGVVSVVAAGNTGPTEKTLGAPGASAFGITVGASDAAISIPTFSASSGEKTFESMKLLGKNFSDDLTSFEGETHSVVFAGLGKPEELTNVSGKIALIERGELSFDAKIQNAKEAGALAVIIYNNVDGEIPAYLGESTKYIPSFQLSKADGEYVKGNPSLSFNQLSTVKTEGDSLADFSSRGPVNSNYDIKPDLVAPGVSIFSTYPEFINSPADGVDYSSAYARISGTSMATPHIAGVAALMLQQNPDMDPFAVKTALMNSSDDLKSDYSVFEVGAGRVDAYQAVHSNVSLQVLDKTTHVQNGEYVEIDEITGSISFGNHYLDSADITDSRIIKVTNNGQQEQTYKVEVEYHHAREGVQDGVKNNIQIETPNTLTVGAGSSEEMTAGIVVPQTAEMGRYEGYIHVTNDANPKETYQIPFAIRVTDKGIDFAAPLTPSVTNDTPMHQYLSIGTHITFKFKSPMEYFDLIVKEAKTGKAVGIIGTYDGTNAEPDKEYAIYAGFRGAVYPFTGKKDKPIADYSVKLPEGEYVLEMISTDADGKKYHYESLGIVDNTPPEVNLDIQPGVVEINDSMLSEEDGHRAYWVNGQVTDKTVDLLQSKGYPYTQKTNTAVYFENGSPFFSGSLKLEDNGDTKFGVLPEEYTPNPYEFRIFPWDMATAAYSSFASPRYVFMKEGTEHATLRYNKDSVKLGDEITVTLDINNVKNFMSGTFDIQQLAEGFFEFQGVKVNEKFASLAREKDAEITLDEPITNAALTTVGASLSGEGFEGLDGDMPFLDVTFKVVDDKTYAKGMLFGLTSLSYKKAGETEVNTIPGYSLNTFKVMPKHSLISGYIKPEAFLVPGQSYIQNIYDMTKLKAKVYAKDADGNIYPGTIKEKNGRFEIAVPASSKAHSIYVELPGHTIEYKNQMLSMPVEGEYFGTYQTVNPSISFAGDVTGDQVIDIRDIKDAVDHYGKQNPENENLDINQDGVVNETDVRWIEKNFLTVGPKAGKGNKPKESIAKKGMADFLKMIGLEPKGK
ncbi:S8 family serine peptidase [Neobacillus niacini]|uniref:S8 family serine peptidase n=1 Tax=Neobacillus niacini TaxID=86668 RepID=UPI001C8DC4C5|nr:S8 family serine peptidase [Neobacillus niacini]MBY0146246.1 S8 family serine peptidase [Neobacillus niacini]